MLALDRRESDALPVTPAGFAVAARLQAQVFGFPDMRFGRVKIADWLAGGIVGRSRIKPRDVRGFVYAPAADAPARELLIGCAPLPEPYEMALRVWVVAMAMCDPSLTKHACELAMLRLVNSLKPNGPSQLQTVHAIRCEAAWLRDAVVQLSIRPVFDHSAH